MTNKIKKRYNRIAKYYDILEKPMEMAASKWREKLLQDAKGKVLEVGIGTGKIYGANINRETYDNLLKAGFAPHQIEVENVWLDIVKLIRINNKV